MREVTMDIWIGEKIGCGNGEMLTREAIEAYQLEKLRETVAMAKGKSRFYGQHLEHINAEELVNLWDIENLPFTSVNDLRDQGRGMVCVGQDEVSRIVTLETSGTTGNPKRVYYTEEDQELTRDFFHRGMRNLVDERDRILILLPYERPGSVGDLLASGLYRLGAGVYKYGLLRREEPDCDKNMRDLVNFLLEEKITSMVGAPTQVAKLADASVKYGLNGNDVRSVLLSVEYVSKEARASISRAWNCGVFEHYGMTEMGLGGAVSCDAFEGSHPREADLYFEIIDPKTGRVVPNGEYGEVVFTTLTRRAMPFIRYRTGDISRWLTEPCPCGSILKRLDRVGDRKYVKGLFV